jgi:hypothetical protein
MNTMKDITHSTAEEFNLYGQLGWFGRRKFRRSLSSIAQDPASLEILLDFQSKYEKTMLSIRLDHNIMELTTWYNSERHDNYLETRIEFGRVPELLAIVLVFLRRSYEFSHGYRDLLLKIVEAGDNFGRTNGAGEAITAEQFRLEAAESIAALSRQWAPWNQKLEEQAGRA